METEKKCIVLPVEGILALMEAAFARGGAYHLVITGTSMSPTLQPGRDQVRLVSASSRSPRRGDIVFARRQNGDYVLHRVLRLHADGGCTLNGDGQVWTEEIYPGDVLGVAAAIRRKGKWIEADNRIYRMYVQLWFLTRPFREQMVAVKRKLSRTRRDGT